MFLSPSPSNEMSALNATKMEMTGRFFENPKTSPLRQMTTRTLIIIVNDPYKTCSNTQNLSQLPLCIFVLDPSDSPVVWQYIDEGIFSVCFVSWLCVAIKSLVTVIWKISTRVLRWRQKLDRFVGLVDFSELRAHSSRSLTGTLSTGSAARLNRAAQVLGPTSLY